MKTSLFIISSGLVLFTSCGRTPQEEAKLAELNIKLDSLNSDFGYQDLKLQMWQEVATDKSNAGIISGMAEEMLEDVNKHNELQRQIIETKDSISDLKFLGIW
jgi:hypothetical protein